MKTFSIDYRSLGLFRISLGLVLLYVLSTHALVFDKFHGPQGAFGTEALRAHYGHSWSWSLNWLSDSSVYQHALLLLAFGSAFCLVLGWRTKLATVLSWLLLSSLNANAPPIIGGGDILLNLLLFWSLFLPLGRQWALDARGQSPPSEPSLTSAATAAILLQMAMMYFFTGLSKWNDIWLGGSALDIVLSNERLVRPVGQILREYPWLTSGMTRSTFVLELVLPLVLFSPWKTALCRSTALLLLIGFHIGIELSMNVLMFSYASLAGLLVFIPGFWWELPPGKSVQGILGRIFADKEPLRESRQMRRQRDRASKRQSAGSFHRVRSWGQWFVVALIAYTFFYNVLVGFASSDVKRKFAFYQRPGEVLGLKQYWNMFSDPSWACQEVACIARMRNGTQIDLLRSGARVTDRKICPDQPVEYPDGRSMALTTALSYPKNGAFRKSFLDYVCRQWNESVEASDRQIMECHLVYYPVGYHPSVDKAPFIDLFHLDLRARGSYFAGHRFGAWILFHDNGKKGARGQYRQGLRVGKWEYWTPEGQKQAEGTMDRGKRVGVWKYYQKDKQIVTIDHSKKAR